MWMALLGMVVASLACGLLGASEERRCGTSRLDGRQAVAWCGFLTGAGMVLAALHPAA